MGIISASDLKPGMVLGGDVRSSTGRFLLGKGTRLTSKHIRILKMWGVVEANVEGISPQDVEADSLAQLDPAAIEEAKESLTARFSHSDLEHPAIHELFRLCALTRAREISTADGKEITQPGDTSASKRANAHMPPKKAEGQIDPSKLIKDDIKLPSLSAIYIQINEAINNPGSSASDIADVISKDTSLSARLLKIVNSPFYGFPSKIDTLFRAVTILGTKQLSALALGINIVKVFKSIPSDLMDMQSFWEHSVACGIIARITAGYKKIQSTERLFVAGLLHDIGRLILYRYAPTHARKALLSAQKGSSLLYAAEAEILGFDHTRIGGLLLKKWKLPLSLENSVTYHHSPLRSKDGLEPAIVHVADIVTNALGRGSSGETHVPPLDPYAWDLIGLSPNVLSLITKQMDRQIEETVQFLF